MVIVGAGLTAVVDAYVKDTGCTEEEAARLLFLLPVLAEDMKDVEVPQPKQRKSLSLGRLCLLWWLTK